jgi:hypothetical protein
MACIGVELIIFHAIREILGQFIAELLAVDIVSQSVYLLLQWQADGWSDIEILQKVFCKITGYAVVAMACF